MAIKQNNFYLRWQKAAGAAKTESRSKDLRAVVPGIAVVAVCMAGWGVMVLLDAEKPAAEYFELVRRQFRNLPFLDPGR